MLGGSGGFFKKPAQCPLKSARQTNFTGRWNPTAKPYFNASCKRKCYDWQIAGNGSQHSLASGPAGAVVTSTTALLGIWALVFGIFMSACGRNHIADNWALAGAITAVSTLLSLNRRSAAVEVVASEISIFVCAVGVLGWRWIVGLVLLMPGLNLISLPVASLHAFNVI